MGKYGIRISMKKSIKRILFIIIDISLILFIFLGIFTVAEYRPEQIEKVDFVTPRHFFEKTDLQEKYINNEPINITTWNIGYAGLDETQDFFMDGGTVVYPDSIENIENNLQEIISFVNSNPSDFWFFQEVDENSKRSYNINQIEYLSDNTNMGFTYAYNFKCSYVPYPLPTIGKVMSGIGTYSNYELENSERIQLPVLFPWPIKTVNLKRCLLVSRVSLGEGYPELVLVNVHLEAYDGGAGKIAQTKMLVDLLEKEYMNGNYVIAGGDFNQLFPGHTTLGDVEVNMWIPGQLEENNKPSIEWTFATADNAPTCRSLHSPIVGNDKTSWLYYVIDGFIASPNVSVQQTKALDLGFKNSDHNPVVLEVKLL